MLVVENCFGLSCAGPKRLSRQSGLVITTIIIIIIINIIIMIVIILMVQATALVFASGQSPQLYGSEAPKYA